MFQFRRWCMALCLCFCISISILQYAFPDKLKNPATDSYWGAKRKSTHDCVRVSLMIPITPNRLNYTQQLFSSILSSTRLPCEVLIRLSSFNESSLPSQLTNGLPSRLRPSTRVFTTPEKQFAGANRNYLAQQATMPVVASLDSDDKMAPNRMEALEFVFFNSRLQPDFVLHKWYWCDAPAPVPRSTEEQDLLLINDIVPGDLLASPPKLAKWTCCARASKTVERHPAWANGHMSARTNIWKTVQQPNLSTGEDSAFTAQLLHRGYKGVFVNQALTGYCHAHSDWIELNVDRLENYKSLKEHFAKLRRNHTASAAASSSENNSSHPP